MRAISIFFLVFCFSFLIHSQDDNAKYFDDGGITNPKLFIKTNIPANIGGDFNLGAEAFFFQKASLDIQLGMIKYHFDLGDMLSDIKFGEVESGNSFSLHGKYHYAVKYNQIFYFGFMYRNRKYFCIDHDYNTKEYILSWGTFANIFGNWYIDYYSGIGYKGIRRIGSDNHNEGRPALKYCLSICYSF